jgi:predicted small secreted protein
MKTWLVRLSILGIILSTLSACNTVRGVGKDVSKTGQVIQRAA